jgi:hypothetical protein
MLGTSGLMVEAAYNKPGTYLLEVQPHVPCRPCIVHRVPSLAPPPSKSCAQVPCPLQRQKSVITLQMTTRNGMLYEVWHTYEISHDQQFWPVGSSIAVFSHAAFSHSSALQDSFVLSFHMHFFRTLKVLLFCDVLFGAGCISR